MADDESHEGDVENHGDGPPPEETKEDGVSPNEDGPRETEEAIAHDEIDHHDDGDNTQVEGEPPMVDEGMERKENDQPLLEEKESDQPSLEEKESDQPSLEEKESDQPSLEEKESNQPSLEEKESDQPSLEEKESDQLSLEEKESNQPSLEEKESNQPSLEEKESNQPSLEEKKESDQPSLEEKENDQPSVEVKDEEKKIQKDQGGVISQSEETAMLQIEIKKLQGEEEIVIPPLPLEIDSANDKEGENEREGDEILVTEEKSVIETAQMGDIYNEYNGPSLPLTLSWSYGFNSSIPVHNISADDRQMIFYSCSHVGIIYDTTRHKQCLLQGHGNPIICTAVSGDRRWLVTADAGQDPLLIIWDSYSGVPVRTFYDGLGQGTVGVALSKDARYLATISIELPQVVSIWDWTNEKDTPLHTTTLNIDYGLQVYIAFSDEDSGMLVSNCDDQVIFYKWDDKLLSVHSTPVSDRDFNKSIGLLSQTVYVPDTGNHWGLSGTSEGYGIVWETSGLHRTEMKQSTEIYLQVKKPVRLMRMHDRPITSVITTNKYIVTGDSIGHVKFYSNDLKLLHWYDSLSFGPISSISFAYNPHLHKNIPHSSDYPRQSTLDGSSFIIPNFTLSTSTATVVHVTANGSIVDVIFHEHDSTISTLSAHPSQPLLLVGSHSAILKLWNYEIKKVITSRKFTVNQQHLIQCVKYDKQGQYIGVGFVNGEVTVINGLSLDDASPVFSYSKDSVTHLDFSDDSKYMATADLDRVVSVYYLNDTNSWTFLARYKSHFKPIQSLMFGTFPDGGHNRLLTLGQDRTLVEYDLVGSTVDDLKLLSIERIEQSAVPTAITWYPSLTIESFIITANDQFKLKLYNSTTKMCRKTILGPTFGSPIRKMIVLPYHMICSDSGEEIRRYLVYITNDKLGLLLLPHDGNPHNSSSVTAHPQFITDMSVSHDGKYIFTTGGSDCTVHQWAVNTESLEAISLLGGEELVPFYSLIEDGREGPAYAELEEYFYYAQIRSQGIDCMTDREVSTSISIDQIPFVMRAIGFYPTEQEIENMLNEIRFSQYVETGNYTDEIDLENFIKLYINHRPVFGLSPNDIKEAFKLIGRRTDRTSSYVINQSQLLDILQKKGEHLTETELIENLMTLLDKCVNPEIDGLYHADPFVAISNDIPSDVNSLQFIEDILCLQTPQ